MLNYDLFIIIPWILSDSDNFRYPFGELSVCFIQKDKLLLWERENEWVKKGFYHINQYIETFKSYQLI